MMPGPFGHYWRIWTIGVTGRWKPRTWYQFDAERNVAQRLDGQGAVVSSDVYDAYGQLLAGGDATDPFGYKGQVGYYTDHATGLILCTFRYYDPATGTWLTRDPIGFDGGVNLYGYCGGDALNYVDWDGRNPVLIGGALALGAIILNPAPANAPRVGEGTLPDRSQSGMLSTIFFGAVTPLIKLPLGSIASKILKPTRPQAARAGMAPPCPGGQMTNWRLGSFKSMTKWQNQMANRGWTSQQITEAIESGQQFSATNMVNKGNSAIRYVHLQTGRSVVVDTETREILQVGGDGFLW